MCPGGGGRLPAPSLTLLVHDDHVGAEDTEEAGRDEDEHGDEEHHKEDLMGLDQVEVSSHKVVLVRRVEAGEARLSSVVATVSAKIPATPQYCLQPAVTCGTLCILRTGNWSSPRGSSSV